MYGTLRECEGVLSVRTASSFHNVHGFNSSDLHKQPSFVQTPLGGASVTQFRVNIVYEKSSQLLPFALIYLHVHVVQKLVALVDIP